MICILLPKEAGISFTMMIKVWQLFFVLPSFPFFLLSWTESLLQRIKQKRVQLERKHLPFKFHVTSHDTNGHVVSGKKDTLPCDIVMWGRLLAMFHCYPNIQHRPLIPKTHKPPQLVSLVEDKKTVSSTGHHGANCDLGLHKPPATK